MTARCLIPGLIRLISRIIEVKYIEQRVTQKLILQLVVLFCIDHKQDSKPEIEKMGGLQDGADEHSKPKRAVKAYQI